MIKENLSKYLQLIACLALGAGLSIALGQDASWDLRNYHLYNPFAALNRRFDTDFFIADKQTGNNPTLDMPYMLLALGPLAYFPRLLAAFMGLPYGLLIFVTWILAERLFTTYQPTEKRILSAAAAVTAISGAMALSLAGSVSNDVTIGMLVLAGFLFAEKDGWKNGIGSGVLFGLAAGFKPTGAVYAPAMLLALLMVLPFRAAIRRCVIFTAAWLAGFAASFGWWGWFLWQRYDNPAFPLFNDVFKSSLAPLRNLRDLRFLPHDFGQWLAYPFYWAFDANTHPVYEWAFRDPRMAFAYILLIVLGGFTIWSFRRNTNINLTPTQKLTFAFLIFSYAAWLITSSILRYAVAIEVLSALVALFITAKLAEPLRQKIHPHAPVALTIVLGLICIGMTQHPMWERRGFSDTMFAVDTDWVKPDTMFLGLGCPVGYLAAFVPPEKHATFVGLYFVKYLRGTPLGDEGQKRIREHQGPLTVLFQFEEQRHEAPKSGFGLFLPMLEDFGLSSKVTNCHAIDADLAPPNELPAYACDAAKAP